MLYTLSPQTQVRASWGRFVQSQGINELQVEDGVDTFYPAQHADHCDPRASIMRSPPASTCASRRIRKDYRHINPRFENLFDPLVLLPEAEFDRVRIAPDSARAKEWKCCCGCGRTARGADG